MKTRTLRTFIATGALLAAAAAATSALPGRPVAPQDENCFTVVVGKKASADGSVIVAHNEDDGGNIIVNVRKIKARDYGPVRNVALGRGAIYETDGKTAGFLWIEATTQEFADSFVNEHGVLITSDSCASKETKNDLTKGGIGYMLRRLMAEKARSAREAVTLAGKLVEAFGYTGSGRTYTVADGQEAWLLAVIRGRHWFAQRVPDDEVAVLPNHYTIRGIQPADPSRFLGSRDIIAYAQANGWYEEAKDGHFDFKKAFARSGGADLVMDRNTLRHWRGLSLLTGKTWEIADTYPFSVKPAKPVAAAFLMDLLRDHYEGTEYDLTNGHTTGTPNRTKFRTICTTSTINAFVVSLNAARPEALSISGWLAFGKPDTTVFLPIYYGVDALPAVAGIGSDAHDDETMYAQHFKDAELQSRKDALLNTRVLRLEKIAEADYPKIRPILGAELGPLEKGLLDGRAKFEAEVAAVASTDPSEARRKLTEYVAAAFDKAAALTDALLKKLGEN
jgi:dipeptidase